MLDDEADVAGVLAEVLDSMGYQTSVALNAEAAFAKIAGTMPIVVICGCCMPTIDGPRFYAELHSLHPDLCRHFVLMGGDLGSPTV